MSQEQERKRSQRRPSETPSEEEVASPSSSAEALKEEMDAILDEIDAVLENNAEEFVKGYVQKGGE
ncbi:MAG: ubiquitin-like protein Pup [Actinomycetota bacterium]